MGQPDVRSDAVREGGARRGAVLSDDEIRWLVTDHALITPFHGPALQGASYDLAVGQQYFAQGKLHHLGDHDLSYELEPGEFVLVTTREQLRLPRDLVARAGLTSTWSQRGVISLFSPQVDPGFVGILVVPLFNAGNTPITVCAGARIITIEFVWMTEPASFAWSDRHGALTSIPNPVRLEMARPDLSPLDRRVGELEATLTAVRDRIEDGVRLRAEQDRELGQRVKDLEDSVTQRTSHDEGFRAGQGLRATVRGWKVGVLAVVVALIAAIVSAVVTVQVATNPHRSEAPATAPASGERSDRGGEPSE